MTQLVNEQTFQLLTFLQWRHHNKGYTQPDGTQGEPHRGYGWTCRCVELPRITFTDWYMMPDKAPFRQWHVDGEDVGPEMPESRGFPPPAEFFEAINKPALLTLQEFVAWMMLGPDEMTYDKALYRLSGQPLPDDPVLLVEQGSIWNRGRDLITKLSEKGLVIYNNQTDTIRRAK